MIRVQEPFLGEAFARDALSQGQGGGLAVKRLVPGRGRDGHRVRRVQAGRFLSGLDAQIVDDDRRTGLGVGEQIGAGTVEQDAHRQAVRREGSKHLGPGPLAAVGFDHKGPTAGGAGNQRRECTGNVGAVLLDLGVLDIHGLGRTGIGAEGPHHDVEVLQIRPSQTGEVLREPSRNQLTVISDVVFGHGCRSGRRQHSASRQRSTGRACQRPFMPRKRSMTVGTSSGSLSFRW
ncbi:hypothetical protein GCM10027612_65620 [Microbispora bryophytorum subsp. camponoti]